MKMQPFMWLVGFLALGMIILSSPAYAVQFDLTNWNDSFLDASTDKVTVDVTTSSNVTTLVFTWVSGNSGLTALGFQHIGYDSTVGCCAAGTTAGWGPFDSDGIPPSHNMDGFGSFLSVDLCPGCVGTTVTLVLLGDAQAVLGNAGSEVDFAAQVRYGDDCSGYVSGRVHTGDSSTGCGAQVPEPDTLLLLGSGLMALGLWRRMRKNRV